MMQQLREHLDTVLREHRDRGSDPPAWTQPVNDDEWDLSRAEDDHAFLAGHKTLDAIVEDLRNP